MRCIRYAASGVGLLALASAQAQPPRPAGQGGTVFQSIPEVSDLPSLQSLVDNPPRQTLLPADTTGKTLTVRRFEFAGNSLYPAETLAALLSQYVGRPLTLLELHEAADLVTAFYIEQGYSLASAVVPAQSITDGSVRIEVVEGRVGKLRYEGLKRYRPETLDRYLQVTEGALYRGKRFETAMRTVDGLPGLDARAQLRPGESYGQSDIVVEAREQLLEGNAFIDNAGTESIGVFRYGGQLSINNPLRIADQLSLSALRSRSSLGFGGKDGLLNYGAASYSLPTGWAQSRLTAAYGYAEFDVQGMFSGVSGNNQNARLELSVPVLQDTQRQLDLTANVNHTRADTDFSGTTFAESKVSAVELGGSYQHTHAHRAVSQVTALVAMNVGSLDAAGVSERAARLELDLQHLMPLPRQLQLLVRGNAVYGSDVLPDTQKFALGGPGSVRGYAPSEARGDWGYLGQMTLRRPFAVQQFGLTPRLFIDAGTVRQHDGQTPQRTLSSAGGGFDLGYQRLTLKLDYAVPLSSTPVSDGKEDGRLYGTFSFAF